MSQYDEIYERAQRFLPGGVSSSARAAVAEGGPFYVARGDGAHLYDLNGRAYLDFSMSHGASLLGHNHPKINAAVRQGLDLGTICSMETRYHGELAEKICMLVPCMEMVRFAGSGTETTMHCLRAARAYTGRDLVVKFEGHFHGMHDYLQYNWFPTEAGRSPGGERTIQCESAGVPPGMEQFVIVLPFNDSEAVERTLSTRWDEIAAVILEPIDYNAGCVLPRPGFLDFLRDECSRHDVILIFDEILSGFRTGADCAQGYLGVTPDLCTLGKCLGGGAPISAFGGRRDIMSVVAPLGPSTHSGTYNGHLFHILPALAALDEYSSPGFYDHIHTLADKLYDSTNKLFQASSLTARLQGVGARFGFFFGVEEEVWDWAGASRRDVELTKRFRDGCFRRGVYFDVNGHAGFSAAHTEADIDRVLAVFTEVIDEVAKEVS